jgi:hypothetical protein
MRITITFNIDNDYYRDPDIDDIDIYSHAAVADTVRGVADNLLMYQDTGTIRDPNGNTVGNWSITK